jgi:hypothetical protein
MGTACTLQCNAAHHFVRDGCPMLADGDPLDTCDGCAMHGAALEWWIVLLIMSLLSLCTDNNLSVQNKVPLRLMLKQLQMAATLWTCLVSLTTCFLLLHIGRARQPRAWLRPKAMS